MCSCDARGGRGRERYLLKSFQNLADVIVQILTPYMLADKNNIRIKKKEKGMNRLSDIYHFPSLHANLQ